MRSWMSVATCALCVLAPRLEAAQALLDFESDQDLSIWHYEGRPGAPVAELARVPEFAVSGTHSLRFASPAWKQGMAEWPAVECEPPLRDWSGYERLAFDATNTASAEQKLCLFVSDSKHATRDGLLTEERLAPFSRTLVTVPLAKLAARGIDLADIHVMHLFTERPPVDMTVYLDRFTLLKAGEEPAPAPASYLEQLAPLRASEVEALRAMLAETGSRIRERAASVPSAAAWAERTLSDLETRVEEFAEALARADAEAVEGQSPRAAFGWVFSSLEAETDLRVRFEAVRPKVALPGLDRPDVVVGFATSMEKVLPRGLPPTLTTDSEVRVSLARNEKEAIQVVVVPCERDLRDVRLRVTDLVGPDGAKLASGSIDLPVMGYVETKSTPPYGSSHVGWWPDPILEFQESADIATGDNQSFWMRVRAPEEQPPGTYRGKLLVGLDGRSSFAFDLTVQVRDFGLPRHSPLPLAVTFWPMFYAADGSSEGELLDPSWRAHKDEWADMLADHYLSYDSLYAFKTWAPDFDILERLHREGRLGRFNLGGYSVCGETAEETAAWRASTIDVIRPRYERAKELGILDHAYIYGCDENPPERFPGVERAAMLLKQAFPEVLVLTTTYDQSYSLDSIIKSMDGFTPLTPSYDRERADLARAAGKEVWWYICCGPHHPHANMFIEYPAIEGRLLMGAMTAKYRPDGFLYYETSIWNSAPIESGPYTEWDPRSWTTYHGDGSWTCMGPDATPLPTIRLENFRDGLEDYAYYRILEATIAKVKAAPSLGKAEVEWLLQAEGLLDVPEDLVKSMTDYSRDPALVYRFREAIADAIEAAPIAPADPWAAE